MSMYSPENDNHNCVYENNSLRNKVFKSRENKSYSDLIIKGSIWSLMLIVSLVGLILVFKDNYNDKEVIIVSNKNNSYMKNNSVSLNNFEDSISEENKNFLNQYAKDEDTKIIKNEAEQDILNSQPPNKNMIKNNTTEFSNETIKNNSPHETNTSQTKFQETGDTLSNLILDVTNNNASTTEKVKTINTLDAKTSVTSNTQLNKTWLVTIYSSTDLSKAKSTWTDIQSKHSSLFSHKKVYFIKADIPGKGIYYRVSLGDIHINNTKPSFKTSKDASNYCKYLKNNKVNCFITEVEESNLD